MLEGKCGRAAWIFPDNFDVDLIVPLECITESDPSKLTHLAMQEFDPNFVSLVRRGDILIGGLNFGYGHPHTAGMGALRTLGVDTVIAESFYPVFYRSFTGMGYTLISSPGIVNETNRWDDLAIDFSTSSVRNLSTGRSLKFRKLSATVAEVLEQGSTMAYIRKVFRDKANIQP